MSARTQSPQTTLIFDMMSPKGHVRLNRFYLARVFDSNSRLLISRDLAAEYEGFDVYPLGEKPCGSSFLERLALAFRVLRIIRQHKARNVVFLSYDLATLPLVSNVLQRMAVDVTCFEHNTAPNSRLRGLFHRLGAKNVRRLVYTPYLKDLYQSFGLDAEYVPHPCLPCETQPDGSREWNSIVSGHSQGYTKTGFCPSGSVTVAQMEEIAGLYPDVLLVMKSKETSHLPNLLSAPYFENYCIAIELSDFAVIPFASEHKVSGPVFEAIAAGKHVMVLDNVFGRYVKSLFGGRIFFPGDPLPIGDGEGDVGITEYNLAIVQMISTSLKGGPGVRTDTFESNKGSQESGS